MKKVIFVIALILVLCSSIVIADRGRSWYNLERCENTCARGGGLTVLFHDCDNSDDLVCKCTNGQATWTVWDKQNVCTCFIATAAYGTQTEPELDILRTWRDTKLNPTIIGSAVVKTYYAVSPPIANFIKDKEYLKSAVRTILDPWIEHLKKQQEK